MYSSAMNKMVSDAVSETNEHVIRTRGHMAFSLLHAAQAVEKRLDEKLERVGLSLPKLGALTKLVLAGESLPLSELAARLTCVRSNITQLVDRLETDGFVRREEDPKDRRAVRAVLTPLGQERQTAGAHLVDEVEEELKEMLSIVDREMFDRALRALAAWK